MAADVPLEELPEVNLSDRWQQIIHHIAKARKLTYEDYDGAECYNGKSLYEIHRIGASGELATQIGAGLDPEIFICRYGDGGYDFTTKDGRIVDVKSTATEATTRPQLLVSADRENWADLYVLAHVLTFDRVRVIGYCPAPVVKDRDAEPFPGTDGDPTYVVSQDEIRVLPTE